MFTSSSDHGRKASALPFTHPHHVSILTEATHAPRVRLFKRGDKIAKQAKERKLKREYIACVKLDQLLFFTDMGREGATFFQQQMRDKQMAQDMASIDPDMSAEKAQKLFRKSLEHQRKSDNAKRSRFARTNNNP